MSDAPTNPAPAAPGGKDRKVKVAFLVVATIAAGLLYYYKQASRPFLPDWSTDLPAAVAEAKRTNVRVLAVFHDDPAGADARFFSDITLRKDIQAVRTGRFILAKVAVPNGAKEAAGHKIARLPTILVVSPGGVELGRLEGRIGEAQFLNFAKAWGLPGKG
jgi:hypothetical protein